MTNIGGFGFNWGTMTYVMGIVNTSPESFSGDGSMDLSNLMTRVLAMVQDKVDIVDIGGESTKPSAQPISIDEELKRVIPVIKEIRCAFDIPISCDTSKIEVAEEALKHGANIINDVSGLSAGAALTDLVKEYSAGIVLTANQRNAQKSKNIVKTVIDDLKRQLEIANKSQIEHDRIILDPGIGFGKTLEENLALIKHLKEIKALGYPVLLGVSNKSFLGELLDADVNERGEGNQACHALAISQGVDILRVHNVKSAIKTAIVADAISRDIE